MMAANIHYKNITTPPSPLHGMPKLGKFLNIDLRTKRDDLLPISGGGNKLRKAIRIFHEANDLCCDAVVTTGGIQSNHARVVALLAARYGWRCKLILHGSPSELRHPSCNTYLMHLAGADITVVNPERIAATMAQAMQEFRNKGYKPFEIPGGGHSIEGAMAYVEAIKELEDQCQSDRWRPEWIILASGTGATQAGVVVGLELIGWKARVVGVSVARKHDRGTGVIEQSCSDLRQYLTLEGAGEQTVDFRDDWVGEGYEKAGEDVFEAIRIAARMEGIILDPTYTGKALCALMDLVASGDISKGAKVLFWHTGGLLNLLASHYARDIMQL